MPIIWAKTMITIDCLAHHPQHIPTVIEWVWNTWDRDLGYDYKATHEEFYSSAQKHSLPLTMIALDGETIVGMIALLEVDFINQTVFSPWVSDIYVVPSMRGNGIGGKLFDGINNIARALGYHKAYLWAHEPARYLARPERYRPVMTEQVNNRPVTVFEIDLQKNT